MTIGEKMAGRLVLLAALSGAAYAQSTSSSTTLAPVMSAGQLGGVATATAWFTDSSAVSHPFEPLTGRPYSAEQVYERVQTLADGTHITQTNQKVMLYRDSAGRSRTEHIFTPPPGAMMAVSPGFIEIVDPVAGYRYTLNQNNHEARRMAWPPTMQRAVNPRSTSDAGSLSNSRAIISSASRQAATPSPSTGAVSETSPRPRPKISHESLGTQTIEGVTAEGRRITTVYPEGFFGNDAPITVVSETWTSPELKIIVLSKTSDPRSGESTTKLTNLSQTEPDPALFQIPAEYSIVEEQQPSAVIR